MEFIDHTGHIFTLQDYSSNPIGYEYNENPYVFWINDEYNSNLSIKCFYLKPIRFVIPVESGSENGVTISIKLKNTNIFRLLDPKKIQDKFNSEKPFDNIELDYFTEDAIKVTGNDHNDFSTEITISKEDLINVSAESAINSDITREYMFGQFYVFASSIEAGAWLTNILIEVNNGGILSYCPITVGGTFIDETEELIINGKNMGVHLPKDILRAIYNTSFWNEMPDMSLWNQKIKEYLLNYMKLKGEIGNFQSAIAALKWFGYGNRLSLSSLIQTDNAFVDQYICDNFDLTFDVINEYRYFRRSTLLSIAIKGKVESDKVNDYNFDKEFFGEGKPEIEDLFSKTTYVNYDEKDINFYKPYYDWAMNELGLKLACLKYYYQKYFLPVHLNIKRASITEQTFANNIKLLNGTSNLITEASIYNADKNAFPKFPESKIAWLSNQLRTIDKNWIEDNNIDSNIIDYSESEHFFDIDDNCFSIPITFVNNHNRECLFNCILFFYQDENLVKLSEFSFSSDKKEYIINFVIYPKNLNPEFVNNFWFDRNYRISLWCNGNWYDYTFELGIPELDIDLGKLRYHYNYDVCKQFTGWKNNIPQFNANMYLPEMVTVNNINFIDELIEYMKDNNLVNAPELDTVYYYYYDDEGNKTVLSSGKNKLIWVNDSSAHGGHYKLMYNDKELTDKDYPGLSEILSSGKLIYSSLYRNIQSFINLYTVTAKLPDNDYFFNQVYLFDLYKLENNKYVQVKYDYDLYSSNLGYLSTDKVTDNTGKDLGEGLKLSGDLPSLNDFGFELEHISLNDVEYLYGNNDSEAIKDLYSVFFDENGNWNKDIYKLKDNEYKITTEEQNNFDFYLMHDKEYWFVILISKHTIGKSPVELTVSDLYKCGDYVLTKVRQDKKFLLNRMEFISANGYNKFNPKDIVVSRLRNHENIPFKFKLGSKWEYRPYSLNSDRSEIFESPSNIGLMSIGQDRDATQGYYDVVVKYSIDNFVNEEQSRRTKLLITDKIDFDGNYQFNNETKLPSISDEPEITEPENPEVIKKHPQLAFELYGPDDKLMFYVDKDLFGGRDPYDKCGADQWAKMNGNCKLFVKVLNLEEGETFKCDYATNGTETPNITGREFNNENMFFTLYQNPTGVRDALYHKEIMDYSQNRPQFVWELYVEIKENEYFYARERGYKMIIELGYMI